MRRSLSIAALLALAVLVGGGTAGAQSRDELTKAKADFQEGLALQTAGSWGGALEKFRKVAAVKMTPQVRFNIALCEEHLGKLVAALGDYQIAENDAADTAKDVADKAHEAAQALQARIPKITIQVDPSAARADVKLDDVALGEAALGKETRVDPGQHTVVATLGGRKVVDKTLNLVESQNETVVVADTPPPEASPASTQPSGRMSTRTLAYVSGGVGVAGLVVGTVLFFGPRASAISDLDAVCVNGHCPTSSQPTIDRGRLYTGLAEVSWLVGVAGVATGTVLWIRSKDEPAQAGWNLGVAPNGLVARGAW